MMKIIASLVVLLGLVAVVLYFKPSSGASDVMNSTLHKSNSSQSDTSLHSQLKEPAQPKNVSLNSTQPKPVSADTVPLYDTKVIFLFNRLIQKKILLMKLKHFK